MGVRDVGRPPRSKFFILELIGWHTSSPVIGAHHLVLGSATETPAFRSMLASFYTKFLIFTCELFKTEFYNSRFLTISVLIHDELKV